MEEFAMYLNNLWIAYLISCAMCLVFSIGLLIANWWTGEDIEGDVIFGALLVSVIPLLNIYAVTGSIGEMVFRRIEKFSIKGRKKQ